MPELVDLEAYQRERDRIIAEFEAKVAEIQSQIDWLEVEIATVEGQVSYWGGKVDETQSKIDIWQSRKTTAEDSEPIWGKINYEFKLEAAYKCAIAWADIVPIDFVLTRHYFGSIPRIWTINGVIYGTHDDHLWYARISVYIENWKVTLENWARDELIALNSELNDCQFQLSLAQNTLEATTRHMRDLELAKEAAQEEKRGALALWEAEYQAALERKRIEIDSIARDIALGYPTMDAETAISIAEMAYAEALARGFTRLADAIQIATDLADEWSDKPVIPHYTTKTVFCPACGIKLEITSSDIETDNRDLSCPKCGASIGRGIQVRVIEIVPPIPTPPIAGAWDWLKKYAPWLAVAGLGATTIYAALKKR